MSNEYKVTSSDQQSDFTLPVTDAQLDEIYRNQAQVSYIYENQELDKKIHPVSDRIYGIAKRLAKARENRLYTQFFTKSDNRKIFSGSVISLVFGKEITTKQLEPLTEEILKKEESVVGANIFGNPKPNEHIAFFNDNLKSWFFYQSITDGKGAEHSVTLHYEVHDKGVLRISSDSDTNNEFINGQELDNFSLATEMYHERVMNLVYNQPATNPNNVTHIGSRVVKSYNDSIDSSKKAA